MRIGQKIKLLLNFSGIKQIRLAEAVGISPSRLSNYLSDKREPDLDMLTRMAKFLNVDVNYFADMEAVTYPVIKEVIQTDSAETIDIPIKSISAKRYSTASESIQIDPKLIDADIADVFVVEVSDDIVKPLLLKGDYLLVCPISKRPPKHGDFIILTGRNYKAYRVWIYNEEPFITDFNERSMQKLADIADFSVYIVLLFIRRAKND